MQWIAIVHNHFTGGVGSAYGFKTFECAVTDESRASSHFCREIDGTSEVIMVVPKDKWLGDIDKWKAGGSPE